VRLLLPFHRRRGRHLPERHDGEMSKHNEARTAVNKEEKCDDGADDKSAQSSGYHPAPVVGYPPAYIGGPEELHVQAQSSYKNDAVQASTRSTVRPRLFKHCS
jgi:hypothetical protein